MQIECDLGQVVDLCSHGMRVISDKKLSVQVEQSMDFVIRKLNRELRVRGTITRVKRLGLRQFETGIQFTNVDPLITKALNTLGRFGLMAKIPSDHYDQSGGGEPQIEMLDPYKVLGVPRSATTDVIRSAYRRLVKQYHPDLPQNNGRKDCSEKFSRIDSAYKFLRDPEVRRVYDKLTAEGA